MSDFQAYLNAILETFRQSRSSYHITLGELIEKLDELSNEGFENCPVLVDDADYLGRLDSYRGYYSDLAFELGEERKNVGMLLKECRFALNATYMGYKGGEFVMGEDTPLWIADYGVATGRAIIIMTWSPSTYELSLSTKMVDDDAF